MLKDSINIGDAELEIMKVIWKSKKAITSSEIGAEVENKGWKRTTIATFLSRLVEKGALKSEKHGKSLYYTPLISAKEYKKTQLTHLIKHVFGGSAQDLVASLFEDKAITEQDIQELKAIFDDKEDAQ